MRRKRKRTQLFRKEAKQLMSSCKVVIEVSRQISNLSDQDINDQFSVKSNFVNDEKQFQNDTVNKETVLRANMESATSCKEFNVVGCCDSAHSFTDDCSVEEVTSTSSDLRYTITNDHQGNKSLAIDCVSSTTSGNLSDVNKSCTDIDYLCKTNTSIVNEVYLKEENNNDYFTESENVTNSCPDKGCQNLPVLKSNKEIQNFQLLGKSVDEKAKKIVLHEDARGDIEMTSSYALNENACSSFIPNALGQLLASHSIQTNNLNNDFTVSDNRNAKDTQHIKSPNVDLSSLKIRSQSIIPTTMTDRNSDHEDSAVMNNHTMQEEDTSTMANGFPINSTLANNRISNQSEFADVPFNLSLDYGDSCVNSLVQKDEGNYVYLFECLKLLPCHRT